MITAEAQVTAILRFGVTVMLENADPRPCAYARRDTQYRPEKLHFSFETRSEGSAVPLPADLKLSGLSLSGPKLKKDGTPGEQRQSEVFFDKSSVPEWMTAIIENARASILANREGDQ